jgi:hypothetical protein
VFRLHIGAPSRICESSTQRNHNRFIGLNNFLDWLLERTLRAFEKRRQRIFERLEARQAAAPQAATEVVAPEAAEAPPSPPP